MKNIIEKLGLKTPYRLTIVKDVWAVYDLVGLPRPKPGNNDFFENGKRLKMMIDDKNEMLETLIEDILIAEKNWIDNNDFEFSPDETDIIKQCHKANADKISIIEKATGKTLQEIQELIG